MGNEKIVNQKFKAGRWMNKFSIHNLENLSNPENLLRKIFQKCIDKACIEAKNVGINVDTMGVSISSEALDSDINIRFSPITPNLVDSIFNRFQQVEQSHRDNSILNSTFTVNVTAIARKSLTKSLISGGKKVKSINHNIDEKALIDLNPRNNNLCLFYATEITRRLVDLTVIPYNKERSRFRYNDKQQDLIITQLLKILKISPTKKSYDAETYLPIIQQYYDKEFFGRYKIFLFTDAGYYKPSFTTNADRYKVPICIYFSNNHFIGIKTLSTFFSKNNYCLNCYIPYNHKNEHTIKCKGRCLNCYQIGGEYPCLPEQGYTKDCSDCGKKFLNEACFKQHLMTTKNRKNICQISKQCNKHDCGVIYNVKNVKRRNGDGHVCGTTYCIKCCKYHFKKDNNCYIQKYESKSVDNYRIVVYDFEATQDYQPNNDNKFLHEINFICAKVVCTMCIENWQNVSNCTICGNTRTFTWSHVDFNETKVIF